MAMVEPVAAVEMTRSERAEYWLELIGTLCTHERREFPHPVIAEALTVSFGAVGTAVHARRPGRVTQTVHAPGTPAETWEEANRFARSRASTEHPLLVYYLAGDDHRAHDLDAVPDLVGPVGRGWRELARAQGVDRQIAVPLVHGPGRHLSYVVGRGEPFAPDDVVFARRLQGLLRGLAGQVTLQRRLPDPDDRTREVGLTPRETAVLAGVAEGLTADAVARRLAISPRTVHKHLERAYAKLGVCDRVSAVRRAGRLGLV